MRQNKGFSILEAILVLAVVAVIGFVGYLAYTNFFPADSEDATTSGSVKTSDEPVVVDSLGDLDDVIDELNAVSVEYVADNNELNSAIDEFDA